MFSQSRNMFNCELKKNPINLMHRASKGLPQLELACCWYDSCKRVTTARILFSSSDIIIIQFVIIIIIIISFLIAIVLHHHNPT